MSTLTPSLSLLAQAVGAPLPTRETRFTRIVIDSRQVQPGDLFVALTGGQQDGHRFIQAAAAAGAAGALVQQPQALDLPQVVVPDTVAALQRWGAACREAFTHPVIGVTGSNGKTTTKQLLAAVCGLRGAVLATEGNLNNHLGVPLTLTRLRDQHETAIIEMGANHIGEIAQLSAWARPQIGVVTQAGDAHLEGFGSREGIARGKGELFASLGPRGVAIINADDVFAPLWRELAGPASQIQFGYSCRADVQAVEVELDATRTSFMLVTPEGSARVRLPMPGAHNVMNALAAAASACALGMAVDDIARGLAGVELAAGRLKVLTGVGGVCVADDSYNANPTSMRAGLDWLSRQPGRRWAVLGHMAELGADSVALHRAIGAYAAEHGIERCIAVGAAARGVAEGFGRDAEWLPDTAAAIQALGVPGPDVTVLVKGSRSARMEQVVAALTGAPINGVQEGVH
jgi:UDP-N-acetylmuramoyl-tripeptide--D-alanyl-D-alanine ligase